MKRRLSSNEQGFGHVLVLLIVLIVIAVAGFAVWRISNNKKTTYSTVTTKTSTSGVVADSTCLKTYHDNVLCKFAEQSNISKLSYTETVTTKQNGSTSSSAIIKNDGNGNSEQTGATDASGQEFDSIQLGNNTYVRKAGSTTWTEYPNGGSAGAPFANPAGKVDLNVNSKDFSFKGHGSESCGNLSCNKYMLTDSSDSSATNYIWIDTSSYYLRKWETTSSLDNTTMVFSYSTITISAPSPVQKTTSNN